VERILGLPHVDHAEATLGLSCNVGQETLDGPVGRRLEAVLAARELADRLLIIALE